jgi:hypothetical protein
MTFSSKLSPEQWAEARRLRDGGMTYAAIAECVGIGASTVATRARDEGWPAPAGTGPAPPRTKAKSASPDTAGTRIRLAQRLYKVIEVKIKMMELRMHKQLQAHESIADGEVPPAPTKDERESFAALIDSINKVTEMASEPAPAADGSRRAAAGAVNPELSALSDDIDPDGLAEASEKDEFRRRLAEHLGKMFANP